MEDQKTNCPPTHEVPMAGSVHVLLVWRWYAVIWIWFSTLAAPVEYTTLGCLEPAIGAALARLGFINSRGHF